MATHGISIAAFPMQMIALVIGFLMKTSIMTADIMLVDIYATNTLIESIVV